MKILGRKIFLISTFLICKSCLFMEILLGVAHKWYYCSKHYIFGFNNILSWTTLPCTDCKRKYLFGTKAKILNVSFPRICSRIFLNPNKLEKTFSNAASRKSWISNEHCNSSFHQQRLDFKFALGHFGYAYFKFLQNLVLGIFLWIDIGLKLKIVPDSWKWIRFWKFGPYWVQKY